MLFHDDRAPTRPLALDGTDKKIDPAKPNKESIAPPQRFVTQHEGSFHGTKLNCGECLTFLVEGVPAVSATRDWVPAMV
jgi:hypothetical protein